MWRGYPHSLWITCGYYGNHCAQSVDNTVDNDMENAHKAYKLAKSVVHTLWKKTTFGPSHMVDEFVHIVALTA